ncbi:MAG: NADH-quinone oxidoreductase subunit C [Desulfonatronovibrionaceae bacterium]
MKNHLLDILRKNGAICRSTNLEGTGYKNFVFILPAYLEAAVKIVDAAGYFLEDITCCQVKEGLELIYHFDHYHSPGRICLRTLIDEDKAEISSIASIYPGAQWHERECTDFFGLTFQGNPNPVPLLLSPQNPGPVLKKKAGKLQGLEEFLPESLTIKHPGHNSGIEDILAGWAEDIGKDRGQK